MSALPRPDLAPGPHRDLVEAVHELHHRAGWPSLRSLARATGVSHTTVSKALSSPTIPSWGTLELIVEALGGDPARLHDLWLAASGPTSPQGWPAARIAGRTVELEAVRRHLGSGTGVLLVIGEAGIGKTTLVDAARTEVVAVGRCHALSAQVPLLPVIDALRTILETDPLAFEDALAACPPYVAGTLSRVLPELGVPLDPGPQQDDWARERLFAALRAVLGSLSQGQRRGIVLEDLHWADAGTLEFLEDLGPRNLTVPVVGTWRRHDLDTAEDHESWLSRVRRQRGTEVLELELMSREDTATQLEFLRGGPCAVDEVAEIYRRTLGHPLFTAQLAMTSGPELPDLVGDLLDHRLRDLAGDPWTIVRALGVADRSLRRDLVQAVTGLADPELTEGLRTLADRYLLDRERPHVGLIHPLLAEAVRRRLVPGEAGEVHQLLADALATHEDAASAEVAAHYRAAGDASRELPWRIRAAQVAGERGAPHEAADHWLQALDVWPPRSVTALPVTHAAAVLAAVTALDEAGRDPAALTLAEATLHGGHPMDRDDRFELGLRAASITWGQHGPGRALELLNGVVSDYGDAMSPDQLVRTLRLRSSLLAKSGHNEDALAALESAFALRGHVTEMRLLIRLFGSRGWHLAFAGDLDAAIESFEEAWRMLEREPDPEGEAFVAMMHTDALLHHARPADEVARVAESALAHVAELDLRSTMANMVRSNVAEAWLNEGRPDGAAALVPDDILTTSTFSMWPLRLVAARVAVAEGRLQEAIDLLDRPHQSDLFTQLSLTVPRSEALMWLDRSEEAVDLLSHLLGEGLVGDVSTIAGPAFVMLARAMSDRVPCSSGESPVLRLVELRRHAMVDPLGPGPVPASRHAFTAQWEAELSRAAHRDTCDEWVATATAWDHLRRPHDAAYCRWRAAQVALRDTRGTAAQRLLKRAAADARDHVPLRLAITATATDAH